MVGNIDAAKFAEKLGLAAQFPRRSFWRGGAEI